MKRVRPIQIDWKPNKQITVPVYRQIVQYICDKVANGEWTIGSRLPSQRALAEAFAVNRSTIFTAIDELTSYGIIAGKSGAGTQIVSNTWSLMLPTKPSWKKLISSGSLQENNRRMQQINRLEFAPDIIRLGTGELDPRLFPQKMWTEVLQKMSVEITSLGYAEPLGIMELRQAIVEHMRQFGINVSANNVLVTSGALQGLQLIASCMLEEGSTVFTEAPTYLKSLQMFQSAGLNLKGIPMDHDGLEYWQMKKKLHPTEPSILYTIPTNQNPTGITMSNTRRKELMDFCIKNRLPIIEDGAYQELCFDDELALPLKAIDENGMVMYLGSASKTLAPGLRIGWVIASEPVIQRLGDAKMQMDYGASSLSQLVFAEFLNSGKYGCYLADLKQILKERRDNALEILAKDFRDIATWDVPIGGFYIWLTFNDGVEVDDLFEKALAKGILLNPGDIYDFKHNRSLRLSFAYVTCEEFTEAMRSMRRII
ncbi:PLP-dependent aminotransferase family protein [Companilactobacillus nantensis]|uniref:GntR family transcriptional regulator n=1 Tax=Companilactobacillus nantensis DSM 16982 TaxID=1423774 RepID=A0A0R1WIB2_9LACO|nr:PLP-dependent aminotransferase family protein [Companilactobacillus nantensis]KRM17754.1 GntR family transcriptional regulator [Companilactobacillus nantensis DSM 16982]GEO63452.1 GntR family transcriptional regulator [Companilactobacillus nantensis]